MSRKNNHNRRHKYRFLNRIYKSFSPFQIRWREKMGNQEDPYLIRWMLVVFGYSFRLHHWIGSDDKRFFHDHATDLISIVLKGQYENVTPDGRFSVKAGSIWFAKAKKKHYLDIHPDGAWTLLFCSRPYHKWGFWITPEKMLRPSEYFKQYRGPAKNKLGREVDDGKDSQEVSGLGGVGRGLREEAPERVG